LARRLRLLAFHALVRAPDALPERVEPAGVLRSELGDRRITTLAQHLSQLRAEFALGAPRRRHLPEVGAAQRIERRVPIHVVRKLVGPACVGFGDNAVAGVAA
jgi:hypothetical protein